MNKNYNKKLGKKLLIISLLVEPYFLNLYIISMHSSTLINKTFSYVLLVLSIFFFFVFIDAIVNIVKGESIEKKKSKKLPKVLLIIFFTLYIGISTTFILLLYIPKSQFKKWLIPTAMTTMEHQYLATWFYGKIDINTFLASDIIIEGDSNSNPDLIVFEQHDFSNKSYKNQYERDIFEKEKDTDLYKIIDIKYENVIGKLAIVYDPSKVKLGLSSGIGTDSSSSYGQYSYDISKRYNASIAINAGGFIDINWSSNGGVPAGIVISEGKIINSSWGAKLIGFNKDNKLVLKYSISAEQAIKEGIRDAVEFGPFLIVNGVSSFVRGGGGWGMAPRTVIGQRKDGIVLLFVADGRQPATLGADMGQLTAIMENYGAYNAANLDGGVSTSMTLNHKIINHPVNTRFEFYTRPIPNAWIVVDK